MGMSLLSVLGIVFLVGLLLVGGILLFLWLKFRSTIKTVLGASEASSGTPQTLHLNEISDRAWLETADVKAAVEALEVAGYVQGKIFETPELPTVIFLSLHHPGDNSMAVVYSHETIGAWMEITAKTETGYLTVTNSGQQAFSDYPVWVEMHSLAGEAPDAVIAKFEASVAQVKTLPIDMAKFREVYEAMYRKIMQWKNNSGGATFEEVRTQSEKMGQEMSTEQLREGYQAVKRSEFNAWHLAMLEELRVQTDKPLPDAELFLVPNKANCLAFVDYIEDYIEFSEKQSVGLRKAAKDHDECGRFFDAILKRLSPDLRPTAYGNIEFPLNARVFVANETQINVLSEE